MRFFHTCTILLFLMAFMPAVVAQKAILREAESYFDRQNYERVVETLSEYKDFEKRSSAARIMGIALVERHEGANAVPYLQSYLRDQPDDLKVYYYLGRALMQAGLFEDAASALKHSIRSSGEEEYNDEVQLLVLQCESSIRSAFAAQVGFIENLGPVVNSASDEILPHASRNHESRYYFSSNRVGAQGGFRNEEGLKDDVYGQHYHDMYWCEVQEGGFSSVQPIGPLINSSSHDYLGDFNESGSVLLFVKDMAKRGAVTLSDTLTLEKGGDYYPSELLLPFLPAIGDRHIQLVQDTLLLIASAREGGFGGYDLYMSIYADSTWCSPINLGPKINSPFDELSPMMTIDGLHLYYASNRPTSMGGFDLFHQQFSLETTEWTAAQNMYAPVNSPSDEIGITFNRNGTSAIISSNRPGGQGGFDLYMLYLKEALVRRSKQLLVAEDRVSSIPELEQASDSDSLSIVRGVEEVKRQPAHEIVLPRIEYDTDRGLATPRVQKLFASIVDAMRVYPGTRLVLQSAVPSSGSYARDLFFGAKQAELAVEDLVAKGASESDIFIEGLPGRPIDYSLAPRMRSASEAILPLYPASSNTKADGLGYRVLLAQTRQLLGREELQALDATVLRQATESTYSYYSRSASSYVTAKQQRLEVLRVYPKAIATIQAFMDGFPISNEEATRLQDKYTDLQDYLTKNK